MTTFHFPNITLSDKKIVMASLHHITENIDFYMVEFDSGCSMTHMNNFLVKLQSELVSNKSGIKHRMFFPLRSGQSLIKLRHMMQENFPNLYKKTDMCLEISHSDAGYNVELVDFENVKDDSFYMFIQDDI